MADGSGPFVGLDLGTTKVAVVIAEAGAGEDLRILGVGVAPSAGLRRGVVVDVGKTVTAIDAAIDEAQTAAGVEVQAVTVGIAGEHVSGMDSVGAVAVAGRGHEVTDGDRERAIAAARTVAIPFDREVLHVLPQRFAVDDQRGLRDPLGMSGIRLEAEVHIITGSVTAVRNLCRSVQRAGLDVADVVLEPLAASRAVLSEEDRDMGVCLVDIGGGTTDVALFRQGSVQRVAVLGVGGQSVTNDIAICLRAAGPQAESLKLAHASVAPGSASEVVPALSLPGLPGRRETTVEARELDAIVTARMEEIFRLVRQPIDAAVGPGGLAAGVVLTGGGALIDGAVTLAEEVFERPVRLAAPSGFSGIGERVNGPDFATVVGLAHMAADGRMTRQTRRLEDVEQRRPSAIARVKEWFSTLL